MTASTLPAGRRSLLALAVAVLTALLVVGMIPPPAAANPSLDELRSQANQAEARRDQLTSEQQAAQTRLNQLEDEFAIAVEQYNRANVELEELNAEIARLEEEITGLNEGVSEREGQVGTLLRGMFMRGGDMNTIDAIIGGEGVAPTVRRLGYLQNSQRTNLGLIEGFVADRTILDREQSELASARERQAELTAELDSQRSDIESRVASQSAEMAELEQVLAGVDADLRQAGAAISAEEERIAQRQAEQESGAPGGGSSGGGGSDGGSSRPGNPPPSRGEPSPPAPVVGNPSGAAGAAVSAAMGQIGTPYVWGGSSPGGFDCSGLTSWAYRQAGVSIPRTSGAQFGAFPRVSRDQLQPGDLVYFGPSIHHVGMYIGGGMMVEAPRTGLNVRTAPISRRDYAGANRPTG